MPLIDIKSLPFEKAFDASAVVESICREFSVETKIAIEHVTVTWEFFASGSYAVGGEAVGYQPQDSHPVLVNLLTPDLHSAEEVEQMLSTLAACIARQVGLPVSNIFIDYRPAHSGAVFDAGEIVRW